MGFNWENGTDKMALGIDQRLGTIYFGKKIERDGVTWGCISVLTGGSAPANWTLSVIVLYLDCIAGVLSHWIGPIEFDIFRHNLSSRFSSCLNRVLADRVCSSVSTVLGVEHCPWLALQP